MGLRIVMDHLRQSVWSRKEPGTEVTKFRQHYFIDNHVGMVVQPAGIVINEIKAQ